MSIDASLEAGTGCLYHERYVSWLDKLERRIGFIAIPGLIRIVVGFTALVFILVQSATGVSGVLALDPAKIRHGEVWRLITYIFLPSDVQLLVDRFRALVSLVHR